MLDIEYDELISSAEAQDRFVIGNDATANWAIKKIKAEEDECERLVRIAEEEIRDLENRIARLKTMRDGRTAFLRGCLRQYFETVPHKETKTQSQYKLLDGNLVMKKATVKIDHDDDRLLEYLKKNDLNEFIKVKETPAWAEFKKMVTVDDFSVVDSVTGEIIPGLTVVDEPEKFEVKF